MPPLKIPTGFFACVIAAILIASTARGGDHPSHPMELTVTPDYRQSVLLWLEKFRYFPESASRREIEGQTIVRITIAKDGKLLASTVKESSGYELLDTAAIDIVRRAAPYPPIPKDVDGASIQLTVPIEFRLKEK